MLIQNSGCNYGLQCTENVTCKIRCQNKEQNFEGEEAINLCLSQLRKRNTKSKFIKMQWKCIKKIENKNFKINVPTYF
jgi:hypothetical protein